MAHPECSPEVLDMADEIASTAGMLAYASKSEANQFIVGTEMGLVHRLRKENPEKKFYLPTEYMICPTMKMTSLEKVLLSLDRMEHVTTIPEEIRVSACKALDAMLAVKQRR